MKNKFKLLSCFLVFVLLVVLAGCQIKAPTDKTFNVMGGWTDGGEGVYTFNTNTTSKLAFSYNKATFPAASIQSKLIDEDLSIYKKLVITTSGTGTAMVKLVCADGTTEKTIGINVTGVETTYAWNLMNDSEFLKSVTRVVIEAAPAKEKSVGSIEITKFRFYETVAGSEQGEYITNTGDNFIPTNVNEYNGTDANFNFNAKWENANNDDIYTITVNGDVTTANFTKEAGKEWACIQALVKGDFSNFNYAVFVVKGTAGDDINVKVAPGFEKRAELTGEEQTVVVDFSAMTLEQKNSIPSGLIFGRPGLATGTGSFDILQAYMTNQFDTGEEEEIVNTYDGTSKTFSVTNWYDNADGTYEVTKNGTDTVLAYDKEAGQEWSFARVNIAGDVSVFDKIEIEVTGVATKSAMFKVEGLTPSAKIEQNVSFDGTRQLVVIDLHQMTKENVAAINKVMVFAGPGAAPASGTLTIHSVTFKLNELNFTQDWSDNGDSVYTLTPQENGSLKVDYVKEEHEWPTMKHTFTGDLSAYNTLNLVLNGEVGKGLMVKFNGVEHPVSFTSTDNVTLTLPAEAFNELLIFASQGQKEINGTFYIVSATLSYTAPTAIDPSVVVDVNKNWIDKDGKGYYTFTNANGGVKVDYNRPADQSWTAIQTIFEDDLSNHNALQVTVKGEVGKQLIIKPNDANAYERTITFDGTEQTFTFFFNDAPVMLLILVDPIAASTTGSFDILSAKVLHLPTFAQGWIDNGDAVYTFTTEANGNETVNYTKGAGQLYSTMKYTFTDVAGYNTITMVLSGTKGTSLLIKPNDSEMLKQEITFGDTKVVVTVSAEQLNNIFIFAEPNTENVSGSFTIISAGLSYVKPDPIDPSITVDVNKNWVDRDGKGYYTFTNATSGIQVNYNRPVDQSWAAIQTTFEDNLSLHNTVTVVVKGEVGTGELIIKPNDGYEQRITLDGTEQTFTFTMNEGDAPRMLLILVDPFLGSTTGSFEILSVTVTNVQ